MSIFERIYMTMTVLRDRHESGEKGAAMVEYALLVAGMAIVVGLAVTQLGGAITGFIGGIAL